MKKVLKYVPEKFRDQAMINLFGFFQVPMIFWIGPKVIKLSDEECRIEIKLNRRTKNHLNSMYFGVLSAGADIAGGLIAMKCIEESGKKVALSFKDFHADFLKRAEGDTLSLDELKSQVTSKGGLTEKAILTMKENGIENAIHLSMNAAKYRDWETTGIRS